MMWKFDDYKDRIAALDDTGNTILYRELQRLSEELSEICHRGLVFAMCGNTIGSFAGYAAMIQGRVVPVMLSADLEDGLFEQLVKIYQPEFFWIPREKKDAVLAKQILLERYGYVLIRSKYPVKEDIYEELALLLTTSGSTGSPKLVRQSYENIRANTESIVQYLELTDQERPITTLPMNYTYGLSIINSHLYVGATILLTEKSLMRKEFWSFLKEQKATSFGGVPYTYEMLKKLRFFRMELPDFTTMTQAGGKLTPHMHKEFAEYARDTGRKFVVMYGQTEATARMAYLPPEKSLEKAGSMGVAIPGGRFRLLDVDGNEIDKPDIVGELEYRGANVTLGYAEKREDLKRLDERSGVLLTGDMAKRDADGYYYIAGRKKRFLKMFGKRINMDEIERLVKEQFQGIECASAGIDDGMYLFITEERLLEAVHSFAADKLRIHPSGIKVRYIPDIPKNDAGKTLYKELEQHYD